MKGKLLLAVVLGSSVAFATTAAEEVQSFSASKLESVNHGLVSNKILNGNYKSPVKHNFTNPSKLNTIIQKAAAAEGDVKYLFPYGYFYYGIETTVGGYNLNDKSILSPAYQDCIYLNISNDEAGEWEYQWEYLDPASLEDGGQFIYSTDVNLTVNYPGGWTMPAPKLSVDDISYQETGDITMGGNTVVNLQDAGQVTMGAALYNIWNPNPTLLPAVSAGNADNAGWLEYYQEMIADQLQIDAAQAASVVTDAKVTGVGTYYVLGGATCSLRSVDIAVFNGDNVKPSDDKEFRVNVYKVNDEGQITDELLTYGTCKWSEGRTIEGMGYKFLTFPMMTMDESLGDYENPVTIDSNFFVVLEGLDDSDAGEIIVPAVTEAFSYSDYLSGAYQITSVSSYVEADVTVMGETYSFVDTPATWLYIMDGTPQAPETLACVDHLFMNLDLEYNWLESDSYTYNAPVAGGSNVFELATNLAAEELYVREDEDMTLPDWLSFTIEDGAEVGTAELTVEAEPLSADVAGRSATITLYGNGVEKVFTIQQGEAGIEAVETSANRVSVVDGNFEVEAAGATSVDVYNVAGQKVVSAAIEGTTVVPAQDLAKGLYILKFNDNTAVKVMK